MFVGEIQRCSNIGVSVVYGLAITESIGTIEFKITDSMGRKHDIRINKFIFLLSTAKNLISVSQWSVDKQDYVGVMSK